MNNKLSLYEQQQHLYTHLLPTQSGCLIAVVFAFVHLFRVAHSFSCCLESLFLALSVSRRSPLQFCLLSLCRARLLWRSSSLILPQLFLLSVALFPVAVHLNPVFYRVYFLCYCQKISFVYPLVKLKQCRVTVSQNDNELKISFSIVNAFSRQKYAGYPNSRLEPAIQPKNF